MKHAFNPETQNITLHRCVNLKFTNLSIVSRRRLRLSKDSAIRRSWCFSSIDLGCVHSMTLMSPARENSMDPSSLCLPPAPPFRKPNSDFCFAFLFASSASFFSCSSSCKSAYTRVLLPEIPQVFWCAFWNPSALCFHGM